MRRLSFWGFPMLARIIFRVSRMSRQRKLARFYSQCRPAAEDLVLDVGVTPVHWSKDRGCPQVENFLESSYPWPERIVALSIDPLAGFKAAYPQISAVQADACRLPFVDGAFDIVFTNAVIEHVGDRKRQAEFVGECLRVARRAVFLSAPNRLFPYDTHVGLPLAHWLPRRVWRNLVFEDTLHLISPLTLRRLFPSWSKPKLLSGLWSPSTVLFASRVGRGGV